MNQQQPFQFLPILASNWQQPQQAQKESREPPARVCVALALLRDFTHKQQPLAAVNEHVADWRDGQLLDTSEKLARDAACHLLADYFRGKLQKTTFEKDPDHDFPKNKKGFILNCPVCFPKGWNNPACPICKGAGEIVAFQIIAKGNE